MTLMDYLDARGETPREFAGRIGLAYTTIRKIAYRQRQPSLPLAVAISIFTEGEVSPQDMVIAEGEPEGGRARRPKRAA